MALLISLNHHSFPRSWINNCCTAGVCVCLIPNTSYWINRSQCQERLSASGFHPGFLLRWPNDSKSYFKQSTLDGETADAAERRNV